jgi:hypothetical protein
MARRKRASRTRIAIGALALIALAASGWFGYKYFDRHIRESGRQKNLVRASAERVDVANDGLHVQLNGRLAAGANARDAELGIGASAAVLFRKVEMFQWRERCEPAACAYDAIWSSLPIDSHKFRQPQGHENPPMRLVDAHFAGVDIKLGAFSVDPELAATQVATVDHPVHAAELPPNLAATFADASGALYAGGDASRPRVGEVRVSYRIAPLGDVVLSGVQHGSRLTAE